MGKGTAMPETEIAATNNMLARLKTAPAAMPQPIWRLAAINRLSLKVSSFGAISPNVNAATTAHTRRPIE